jgi:hypothetical protein
MVKVVPLAIVTFPLRIISPLQSVSELMTLSAEDGVMKQVIGAMSSNKTRKWVRMLGMPMPL